MGAENSKPASQIRDHVFTADHPVQVSGELLESLQKNTFTDATRSKALELQYQERLTAELEKLRDQGSQEFSKFSETLSGEEQPEQSEPSLTEKLADATSSSSTLAEKQRQKDMSRTSVTKEIEQLRAKLEQRKRLEQVDTDLNKAKDDVVTCLRMHDRRPLDCWKEVETFKREVGRLEKEFVEKTIR
ncbi:hypothetical protein N0V94_007963 [Neodidymelliopsis sp. IMI 364377]|nr:hypothetical protein N0V94_007963 [Neodidymelliopsis sp. IMI 364377]